MQCITKHFPCKASSNSRCYSLNKLSNKLKLFKSINKNCTIFDWIFFFYFHTVQYSFQVERSHVKIEAQMQKWTKLFFSLLFLFVSSFSSYMSEWRHHRVSMVLFCKRWFLCSQRNAHLASSGKFFDCSNFCGNFVKNLFMVYCESKGLSPLIESFHKNHCKSFKITQQISAFCFDFFVE